MSGLPCEIRGRGRPGWAVRRTGRGMRPAFHPDGNPGRRRTPATRMGTEPGPTAPGFRPRRARVADATPKPFPGCDDDDPVTLAALARLAAAPFAPVDHDRIKAAVREILFAVGED